MRMEDGKKPFDFTLPTRCVGNLKKAMAVIAERWQEKSLSPKQFVGKKRQPITDERFPGAEVYDLRDYNNSYVAPRVKVTIDVGEKFAYSVKGGLVTFPRGSFEAVSIIRSPIGDWEKKDFAFNIPTKFFNNARVAVEAVIKHMEK